MEPLYGVITALLGGYVVMSGGVAYLFKRVMAAEKRDSKCREDLGYVRGELAHLRSELDRMTIESVLDAVIVADDDGLIRQWNPSATMLFGWGMMEVLGQPITMLMSINTVHEHSKRWLAWLNEKRPPMHGPHGAIAKHKDGSLFPIIVTLAAWQDAGKIFCIARARRQFGVIAGEAAKE